MAIERRVARLEAQAAAKRAQAATMTLAPLSVAEMRVVMKMLVEAGVWWPPGLPLPETEEREQAAAS